MQIEVYFKLKQLFKLGILVNQIKNLGPILKHNINFGNFYMISIFSPKKKMLFVNELPLVRVNEKYYLHVVLMNVLNLLHITHAGVLIIK